MLFSIDLIKYRLYYPFMDAFAALGEPTRRNIMEMLSTAGEMPASAIHKKFRVSPPAISQHLKVLKEAGLVGVEKRGQQRIYHVNPESMKQLEKWISQFTARLDEQYSRLDRVLGMEKERITTAKKEK